MMNKLNIFLAVLLLATAATSSALASEMSYRMSIDGNSATNQPKLTPGSHTLVVEAIVTDNEIIPATDGGILQSSFNLETNNGGFTFVDVTGGFIGAPDGKWDSTDFIPPFDSHFRGETTLNGGPTVFEETSSMSPGNFNDKFNFVGTLVWSVVATGDFTYDALDTHPLQLNLTTSKAIVRVAGFDGVSQVISEQPDVLNAASILFGNGNTPPMFVDDFPLEDAFDQHTVATRENPASYQMQGTDAEDGDDELLDWTLNSFDGPFHLLGAPLPGSGNGNQTLSSMGLFEWDPGTFADTSRGFYFAGITVMDSDGATDTGILRVQVPEPSTLILAGLSLVGVFASRRRNS